MLLPVSPTIPTRVGRRQARWSRTVAVALFASLPGLAALAAVGPAASALDEERGLVEYVGLSFSWNVVVLAILAFVLPAAKVARFATWFGPGGNANMMTRRCSGLCSCGC